MAQSVTTFLMFEGRAEEAMTFYASLFPNSEIHDVIKWGPEGPGAEGTLMQAFFTLNGHRLRCFDSPVHHAFTFTPAVSLFVDFEDEEELQRACSALSEGGTFLMGLADYGFSKKFAWLNDRFGVSWQLNLPH
jgi:predicted 3-demethylubiquinone-9 3-methyltransferase (glyoxalase superfamily)